jgi:hypothetical protein
MSKALFVAVLLLGIAGSFAETSYTPEQIHSAFAGGNGLSIVCMSLSSLLFCSICQQPVTVSSSFLQFWFRLQGSR